MGRGDDPPRLSGLMFHRNTSGGQERSFGEVSGGTEYPMKRPVRARPLSEGVSSGSGSGAGVIGGSFRSPPGPQVVVCDTHTCSHAPAPPTRPPDGDACARIRTTPLLVPLYI